MPSPDNLSLSVIGTLTIPKTGFNNTFGSSGNMYQSNKQAVESMPATTIGWSDAAACARAIHRGIGNDPHGASSADAIA
jgi:hypothetical protein